MPDLPDPDLGDLLSDLGELGEEAIGLGPLRRIYNLLKKRIAREYIAEVAALKRKHDILVSSIQTQTDLQVQLRNYIAILEQKVETLESRAKASADRESKEPEPESGT